MKEIQKPWLKLKETIDQTDYDLIRGLETLCARDDRTALKLELDYKLGVTSESVKAESVRDVNEFLYFDGQELIGYIGICAFGGPPEINGMVHPAYRRQGVFTALFEWVRAELARRNVPGALLLCDRNGAAGQAFIQKTGAKHEHSEYEMYLRREVEQPSGGRITLRKAVQADAHEITRQDAIYFGDKLASFQSDQEGKAPGGENQSTPAEGLISPEVEEKRGMTIYLAEMDKKVIGKIDLQLLAGVGGIYGLGVLPEHRGKGFGREILLQGIAKLKEAKAREIMLQVVAGNDHALGLYRSCGFVETSVMDYYKFTIQGGCAKISNK